jgi:hypothetical protein
VVAHVLYSSTTCYAASTGRERAGAKIQESTWANDGLVTEMKNQKALCWAIFVSFLIATLVLCFMSVGMGMAASDCVQCAPIPRPHILYTADNLITLLGFPLVPLGRFIANVTSMTEGGRTVGGISLYVLNGWLFAYWASNGFLKVWRKV